MKSLIFLVLCFFVSCSQAQTQFDVDNSQKVDHGIWTELLKKHVLPDGFVDYQGLVEDSVKLNNYTKKLSDNPPASQWSDDEKMAYWINAYNAFTIKLIVDNYPVESIKDLNPTLTIPLIRTVWTQKWFQIGGEDFSLDHIEHKILRKEFEEPRIHFAVNCASVSCPVLRPEAFTADKLERQLEEQASIFINDESRNKINKTDIQISKIFSWFSGDFTNGQSLIKYLNQYSKISIDENAKVKHLDYDWRLNNIDLSGR